MPPVVALVLPPLGTLVVLLLGRRASSTKAAESTGRPLGKEPGSAPSIPAESSVALLAILNRARAEGAPPAILQVLERKLREALLRESTGVR